MLNTALGDNTQIVLLHLLPPPMRSCLFVWFTQKILNWFSWTLVKGWGKEWTGYFLERIQINFNHLFLYMAIALNNEQQSNCENKQYFSWDMNTCWIVKIFRGKRRREEIRFSTASCTWHQVCHDCLLQVSVVKFPVQCTRCLNSKCPSERTWVCWSEKWGVARHIVGAFLSLRGAESDWPRKTWSTVNVTAFRCCF